MTDEVANEENNQEVHQLHNLMLWFRTEIVSLLILKELQIVRNISTKKLDW